MAKININKPTGSEVLSLLSVFKKEDSTYVIFDSEKVGSMGLPIIYIAKLTDKLEKITDDNEWQSVKNSLKGIINGTNFEYVKIADTLNADEVYYTPLTLPQSSFDLIKNRYVVPEDSTEGAKVLVAENETPSEEVNETETVAVPSPNEVKPSVDLNPTVIASEPEVAEKPLESSVVPNVEPIIPNVNAASNESYVATPNVVEQAPIETTKPEVQTPVVPEVQTTITNEVPKVTEEIKEEPLVKFDTNIFMQDKETFLKACENMFDALISKYQKQFDELERREQALKSKELEVENKLNDASEHLANAEAREQVANIAHDNAQRVMDINNLMPSNPNA